MSNHIWYPNKRKLDDPGFKRYEHLEPRTKPTPLCFICDGRGQVKDRWTGKIRKCVACDDGFERPGKKI